MKTLKSPQMDSLVGEYGHGVPVFVNDTIRTGLELFIEKCHADSYNRGWYHDPITGMSLIPGDEKNHATQGTSQDALYHHNQTHLRAFFPYVVATKIALIHSEASEMLEAFRTDQMDDKIPDFAGITAEAADVMIRVGDLMEMLHQFYGADLGGKYDLVAAILAKMPVNNSRPDHALENRRKPGGKKF